jgi:hypothetical protein
MSYRHGNWRVCPAIIATAIVVLFLAGPLAAAAQQAGKVYRIGVLHLTPDLSRKEAFRDGLGKLGYIEVRTSPSWTDWRRERWIAFPSWPPSSSD